MSPHDALRAMSRRDETRRRICKERALVMVAHNAADAFEPRVGMSPDVERSSRAHAICELAYWSARAGKCGATLFEVAVASQQRQVTARMFGESFPWRRDPQKWERIWDLCNEWDREWR